MHTTATNTGNESFHKRSIATDLTMEEIAHKNFFLLCMRKIRYPNLCTIEAASVYTSCSYNCIHTTLQKHGSLIVVAG